MLKINTYIIVLFFFIYYQTIFSQSSTYHYELKWQSKRIFFEETNDDIKLNPRYLLYFDGATYSHNLHHLPFFSKLIYIGTDNQQVRLKNTKFVSLTNEEISQVVDLNKISEQLDLKTDIKYARKQALIEINFIPLQKNRITGQYEKLVSFDIELISTGSSIKKKSVKKSFVNQSVLSSGNWVKIKIGRSGVYKITFEELQNLGISQPENVRIFGNGGKILPYYNSETYPDDLVENHVLISNNAVYFYGDGPEQWKYNSAEEFFNHEVNLYSYYAYYFLCSNYNSGSSNSITTENQSASAVNQTITSYTDLFFHEIDTLNLIGSGRLWVGEHFDFQTDYTFNFDLPELVDASVIKLKTSLLARSPIASSFSIDLSGKLFSSSFSPVSYDYTATYATHKIEQFEATAGSGDELSLNIVYNKSTASSEGWLDYVCLNVQRGLVINNEQLHFRNTQSVGIGNVGLFRLSNATNNTIIWEITEPQKPKKMAADLSGSILSFRVNTDSLRTFVAFDESMVLSPILQADDLGIVPNQNLHGINQADLVIVTHPDFMEQAIELRDIHQAENKLNIKLLSTSQIYNEFSSGAPDVSAIRNFMKMLYDRSGTEDQLPKYLCLFGDGSYDNKHQFAGNTNYILTYQSENSLSPTQSFVTDDYFGLLDDLEGGHEGLLDIGIGRLPVKSSSEANDMIQKIRNYTNIDSYSDWKNRVCFIADDEDNNLHLEQADELSGIINNKYPVYNIEKIYLDAFVQESSSAGQRYPDVKVSIDNQINRGLLVINYTGHGNENGLSEERIVTIDQIDKWSNQYKLPVFMTATCEFSRFDNFEKTTAGEHVFLNPEGGAIAMYTTTRLVYASPNFELNKNFYNYLFESNSNTGEKYRLGDIMRLTKVASGSSINKRNFTLLGDPALELADARLFIKTNTINGSTIATADTLKALDKVDITGEIQNGSGQKLSAYNGIIYPTVFDKKFEVKTLNNDGDGVFSFSIQNSLLFKGKASIINGDFKFSFIVPKDIKYNIDTGKVSYYSSNYQLLNDAKGYFNNILIGGSGTGENTDTKGPEMRIYLNDENFVSGGITDNNPKLLAFLSDESGINTTGTGIGHDIVASIDDLANMQFVLNDYYESDVDDYTNGQINYSFPELEQGEHTLRLKAWDVYNNSSEDSIIFYVSDSKRFEISHVLNYPNPFSTNTSFFFEHNRPNEPLEIIIHVFTVSGKVVKTIHTELITDGFRIQGIPWDGRDDFGNKPGRGVYFYKLAVRTSSGERAEKIEKLLILN